MSNRHFLLLPTLFAVALAPHVAQGQFTRYPTGNASDVTGPSTPATVGGFFVPGGTVAVAVSPPVAAAISTASSAAIANASSGNLTSPVTGVAIPAAVGAMVAAAMSNSTPEVRAQVLASLSTSGASAAQVNALMSNLPSLLTNPTPGQVAAAIVAFNAVANGASSEFQTSPSPEFVAIHAVLIQISSAARAANR